MALVGEHLAHTRTAARSLVADDDDVTLLHAAIEDCGERLLFAVEADGLAVELKALLAADFADRTAGGETVIFDTLAAKAVPK